MRILRSVELKDEEPLMELALTASTGVITLPRKPQRLKQKLRESLDSFANLESLNGNGKYLFVLENLENGEIEGCSALHSQAGNPGHDYYYKIQDEFLENRPIQEIPEKQILIVPNRLPLENTSEICTLFLSPEFHSKGFGRLLSLSRFLFAASFPKRIKEKIIAEMRGVIDSKGISIFWEAVGRHFCNVNYEQYMKLFEEKTICGDNVISKHPIYISLLPISAQEIIGITHQQTTPAFKILQKEGFQLFDGVDMADGGPKLIAETRNIRAIKSSQQAIITAVIPVETPIESNRPYIISNITINFRACYGEIKYSHKECAIDEEAAQALQLKIGDRVRFVTTKPSA